MHLTETVSAGGEAENLLARRQARRAAARRVRGTRVSRTSAPCCSGASGKAVSVSHLDEPHAKALAAIHRQFGIPLTYLPPDEYVQLMRDLPETHRRVLGCERRFMSWLRAWIPQLPVAWTLRPLAPLVLVEQIDGSHMVITFDKHGRTLTLSPVRERRYSRRRRPGDGGFADFVGLSVLLPGLTCWSLVMVGSA